METVVLQSKIRELIDGLKGVCTSYGLGNDSNEFSIITQTFLYKYLNDKFAYAAKQAKPELAEAESWEKALMELPQDELDKISMLLGPDAAILKPKHLISSLFAQQNKAGFAKLFDDTLIDIADINNDVFAVNTDTGAKITLFDRVSEKIADVSRRDEFCRALLNKLVGFSFESVFNEKYDFYATIFEYLIKDYNKDGGGKYAEYYTPHAVAKIMAAILVPESERGNIKNVTCYDPSAGSGTLLMNLAHAIGENRCTIYSQDISQKSSSLLRLNLILNNLVHSIPNVIQGNTIIHPYHKEGENLREFDYIVSNPPFKTDFSDWQPQVNTKLCRGSKKRFFAGVPKIPVKALEKMAIYQLFLQHIIFSLKENGKAAVVVPTGFLTASTGIDFAIRKYIVNNKMLAGVVSMPSNIFATTGTNVSILFLESNYTQKVVLIDASSLGEKIKEGKNQKTVLSSSEEQKIINCYKNKVIVDKFSIALEYPEIEKKKYILSAGQYANIEIDFEKLTPGEFTDKIKSYTDKIDTLLKENMELNKNIRDCLSNLVYNGKK